MRELRPYQLDGLEALRQSIKQGVKRIVLQLPTGGGKSPAPNEPILMFDGSIKKAKDVNVGDFLMGPDSKPRTVTNVNYGVGPMVRIVPVKGDSWECNDSHILSLRCTTGNEPCYGFKDQIVNVSVKEWMTWNKSKKHLYKLWRTGVEFPLIDPPAYDPYIVGAYLGDGTSATFQITLGLPKDPIKNAFLAVFGEPMNEKFDRGANYLFWSTKHKFWSYMKTLVSGRRFIPREIKVGARQCRLDVLAGLMDTDGHLTKSGYDFISISEQLSRDVAFVARSLGLAAYVNECEKGCQTGAVGTYWRVSISGDTDMVPCRVEHKKAPKRRQIKNVTNTGFTVERLGEGVYRGIALDGDHLFMLGDFTVTHNTLLSASIAQGIISKGNRMAFTVPRIVLVDQTIEEYAKEGIYDVGAIQARHHMTDWGKPIQVCSIDSIRSKNAFPEASVVIFDEIHLLSDTHIRWMNENPNTIFIGLSATPWRRGLGKHFESLLIVSTMKELMELGYLCQYRAFGVSTPDLSGIKKVAGDYHQDQLSERLRGNKVLTADIVDTWKIRHGKDRTLCFAVDLAHARVLQERFVECGINAGYQDARTPADERRALKRAFHDGSMPVLVSVGTLIIGVDYDVRAISWCRPTQSEMLFVQAFGRGMRPAPVNSDPKDHLVFLDHAATITSLGYPEDIIYDELDDGEKKKPEELERKPSVPRPCPKCAMLIPKGLRVCPACLFECKPVSEIHEEDGELVDLTRGGLKKSKKTREFTPAEKSQFYAELKGYAAEKGYKTTWADHKFRERNKAWPDWSIKQITPVEPTVTTRSWIRSSQIRWIKSKKYAETQAAAGANSNVPDNG